MSRTPNKAATFLAAMQQGQEVEPAPTPVARTEPVAKPLPMQETPSVARRQATPRSQLQHFGGYLDEESMEKIAVLRVRLKLDNSKLIKTAIEELYRKHTAKRAFGDA